MRTLKLSFLLSWLLSFGPARAQQYTQNMPFDSTLMTSAYINGTGCNQNEKLHIQLDSSLFTYVNGLQFLVVIDSVSYAGPPNSLPFQQGDTIVLNAGNPVLSLMFVPASVWYHILVNGTPTTANQAYACNIDVMQCTCNCPVVVIKASTTNTATCYVNINPLNSISKIAGSGNSNIYPNPANSSLYINGLQGELSIYNSCGQAVLNETIAGDNKIDVSQLAAGIYILRLAGSQQTVMQLVITHSFEQL